VNQNGRARFANRFDDFDGVKLGGHFRVPCC
jgi:hypothetical protein